MRFFKAQASNTYQRVVATSEVIADFLVRDWNTNHQSLQGLHFRVFNDDIPIRFFDASLDMSALRLAHRLVMQRFHPRPDQTIEAETSTLTFSGGHGERLSLIIPSLKSQIERTINIDFDKADAGEMLLFEIPDIA